MKDETMAKPTRARSSRKAPSVKDDDADPQVALEKQYRASRSAFHSWETAQGRTDQQLYDAIGRLAEFAAAVGNDHEALTAFAARKDVRTTKASTVYTVITKLVVTADRKKACKYTTVLQLAARDGIEPKADRVAAFIKEAGGVEACVKRFRELQQDSDRPKRQGRPSAYSKAAERLGGIDRTLAPDDLRTETVAAGYFIAVGIRDEDGTTHLLRQLVTDDSLVRKAAVAVAPKG
jgi:ribosome-binding factor A